MGGYSKVSGAITESGVVWAWPWLYFWFTCLAAGGDRYVRGWDHASAPQGKLVEDFIMDGDKSTDGHERSTPVYCENGLYFGVTGFRIMVFFAEIPGQA
jgi:hypothetical protein